MTGFKAVILALLVYSSSSGKMSYKEVKAKNSILDRTMDYYYPFIIMRRTSK